MWGMQLWTCDLVAWPGYGYQLCGIGQPQRTTLPERLPRVSRPVGLDAGPAGASRGHCPGESGKRGTCWAVGLSLILNLAYYLPKNSSSEPGGEDEEI